MILLDLPDVLIGQCLIQPDSRKITGPLKEVQLPSRVFAVLQYFIEHRDRVVSRQELIHSVWSGNDTVGQKALTNAIWQLRRAFEQAGAGQEIILTVAKTGYELAVEPELLAVPSNLTPINENKQKVGYIWWLISFCILITLLLLWLSNKHLPVSEVKLKTDMRPKQLTSLLGVEEMPSFSKDGRYIAFMNDATGQAPGIFLMDLHSQSGHAKRLTPNSEYSTAPVWSPDQKQLAYLSIQGNKCRLKILDIASSQSKGITNCYHKPLQNTLSWSAKSNILAFAIPNELGGVSILGRDMQTGNLEPLSSPRSDSQDFPLAFANHTAQLAYVRQTQHLGIIYLRQADGSSRRLTKEPLHIYSLAWSPDDKYLYFNSIWQGELSILQISVQTGQIKPLSYVNAPGRIAVRLGEEPELVYTQYNSEEQLFQIKSGQPPMLMPKSLGRELYPEYAKDNDRLMFMSNRNGRFDFWYSNLAQTELHKVKTTKEIMLDVASMAPDGNHFVVPAKSSDAAETQLYLGTLTGSDFSPLAKRPIKNQHTSWSLDSKYLYFSSNVSGSWQIWRLELSSGIQQQYTETGGIFAREAPDGRVFYVKALEGGIWYQDETGAEKQLVKDLHESDWGNWLVDQDGVYYLQRTSDADRFLFKAWKNNKVVELFRVPGRSVKTSRSITAVSKDEFIVSMYKRREASIMAVPLIVH